MSRHQIAIVVAVLLAGPAAHADQSQLIPDTSIHGPTLEFDWPALQIGVGSYEEGPTGVTIFRFPDRVSAAVDVRGAAPGTINTDLLRLGYGARFVDAVVFSGGSAYGEEAITAVMTGLKDDGVRSADLRNVAVTTGAVIYDFLGHRLNEIYPDKRLAQAALHDLRPGVFPLGAQGAGRMAMQGGFFGCAAHSGEGGAFRQIGETKIAAFVVINASGAITDRSGHMVSCHRNPAWGELVTTSDLLRLAGDLAGTPESGPTRNTTISLVVTNRKMDPPDLQRLAVQVHTSMARGIQPFSTYDDGDTLFAVSTQEVGDTKMRPTLGAIDFIAAETMWDAILASVPEGGLAAREPEIALAPEKLAGFVGRYRMAPNEVLVVDVANGALTARLDGPAFFDLRGTPAVLHAISEREFRLESRYATHIAFETGADGKVTGVSVNPGRWAQKGERLPD
jgi:6-aminohexanoate-oligomer endohydrolase